MNPESEYYFDWHAQIDNPISTLEGAIEHLGFTTGDTDAYLTLVQALRAVVDEWGVR